MKHFSFFSVFFFISFFSFSQDTIILRNKTIVLAKVLEVFPSEIKYKRLDVPDGPIYTELKSSIKGIRYSNGFKEEFKLEDLVMTEIHNLEPPPPPDNKIHVKGPLYFYLDKRLSEREINHILLESNDKAIIKLAAQSMRANKVRRVGFAAIPIAGVALGFAFAGLLSRDTGVGAIGGGCALIAIPIGLTGMINNVNHKAYKLDAIKLYNQKY